MTVIAAVIGPKIMAIASDSFKTKYVKSKGIYEVVEFKRPKIIPVQKYHAAISFWGLVDYGNWSLERYLRRLISNSSPDFSLEQFANYIASQLSQELDRIIPGSPNIKGFGIHLTGYERYKEFMVPELFLISNYDGISYAKLKESFVSERHLYPYASTKLNLKATDYAGQREVILAFFKTGSIFYFNNGDPELFTPIAKGYYYSVNRYRLRIKSRTLTVDGYRQMARGPVETIKTLQKRFAPTGKQLVGGKIHDLVIIYRGQYSSSSGLKV